MLLEYYRNGKLLLVQGVLFRFYKVVVSLCTIQVTTQAALRLFTNVKIPFHFVFLTHLCSYALCDLMKLSYVLLIQNSNVENLPPHVLRLVYKEVSALAADPPEGIKIYPSEEDITELHTAIEGPGKSYSVV